MERKLYCNENNVVRLRFPVRIYSLLNAQQDKRTYFHLGTHLFLLKKLGLIQKNKRLPDNLFFCFLWKRK